MYAMGISSCSKHSPIPKLQASVCTYSSLFGLYIPKVGAFTMAALNFSNAFCWVGDHNQAVFFFNELLKLSLSTDQ